MAKMPAPRRRAHPSMLASIDRRRGRSTMTRSGPRRRAPTVVSSQAMGVGRPHRRPALPLELFVLRNNLRRELCHGGRPLLVKRYLILQGLNAGATSLPWRRSSIAFECAL